MTFVEALFTVLTIVEVLVFVGAVAWYILRITRSLRGTAELLGRVSFGVRAIEQQTSPIGSVVTRINGQLDTIANGLADLADAAGDGSRRG